MTRLYGLTTEMNSCSSEGQKSEICVTESNSRCQQCHTPSGGENPFIASSSFWWLLAFLDFEGTLIAPN